MKHFSIIVAAKKNDLGIGLHGKLPWKLSGDMKYFKHITSKTVYNKKNVVIMGRKTWESIPNRCKPLDNRYNVIVSSKNDLNSGEDVFVYNNFYDALNDMSNKNEVNEIFVIGGSMIYNEAIKSEYCQKIYMTFIDENEMLVDTYFPPINDKFKLSYQSPYYIENQIKYNFNEFVHIYPVQSGNNEEQQYLHLIKNIIENGNLKTDRTNTGTLSIFGSSMRFSLKNNAFPLLTTKKVFFKGVVEELLWFINGSTNANLLNEKGVHIWDGNGSREFLDSRGLCNREVGDLGPVYGFQWRHFGAKYNTMKDDYTNAGIDQLTECINKIKSNPDDRRIIMTAWNPTDLNEMALPPCHMFCQFYVSNNELSCQMYQRSADIGLGVPFNIASYSLLTIMMAHICRLKPGEFIHTMGDTHIYLNHVDALKEQIERTPNSFPKLFIKRQINNIDDFTFDDFALVGYQPQSFIKMNMAV